MKRRTPLRMIDLTRSLPSLQDSLTPPQSQQSSAAEDWLGGLIIAGLIITALALTFGL